MWIQHFTRSAVLVCSGGVLLMGITRAHAAFETFAMCTDPWDQRQPAVSGDIVVWSDERNNGHAIYGQRLSGAEFLISTNANVFSPDVDEPLVVYQDRQTDRITVYDVTSGSTRPVGTRYASRPSINGRYIAYESCQTSEANFNIRGYDLLEDAEFDIYLSGDTQQMPAVSGDFAVWMRGEGIMAYCFSTHQAFPIYTLGGTYDPDISGDIVVWTKDRGATGHDLYAYDLGTRSAVPLASMVGDQRSPATDGDVVVWADYRNGESDIYGYRFSTGEQFAICREAGNQTAPSISGNVVVWEDDRNWNRDIYGAFIPEPATLAMLALGWVGLLRRRRRVR